MRLSFDLGTVRVTEFGVGRDSTAGSIFHLVPVDVGAQAALREMVEATLARMQQLGSDPELYDPAEKHAGEEHVYLALGDALAEPMRALHTAENLPVEGGALSDAKEVFCYFARMTDAQGRRLTALRRAAQFKGILKSRLLRFVSDALQIVEDSVFKLDSDFDLLIDSSNVYILRPNGFEFASKLQEAVLAAAPENIRALRRDLTFVDFDTIEDYAANHPRAARYLASIRTQNTRSISKAALTRICHKNGVRIALLQGKIVVPKEEVLSFLEVLDRRRYQLELVMGSPERFRAASRRRLDG